MLMQTSLKHGRSNSRRVNTDESIRDLHGTVWTEIEVSQNGLIATMYTMDDDDEVTTLDSWHVSPDKIETLVANKENQLTSKHAILME